ncbi:MAG: Thermosome subunit alpha [Candidatus Methanofastidiosum methylothiophilum]|jgi:thermosome|uniref:Thermosome subunit alpha n=1 Tax=Candidatus Methanofastidiosum methylothiophilum TaxID=1705564 RepID=A0A150JDU9_9EURY|nr:MAG: Thermosome subunit alpha [Candidatus Methanofastidiosum methylthiophilus]OQC51807.1 MAG: Thermosome subunit alpha [Euryarchaeota archaeon ADurb.Bin023]HNV94525.1 thermosome subunit alpha [Methanofastidiosum sp.]KYC57555.1 MAG: Thermosome subunit alpha [Candidatus Methanofastidiosum methylthiophilus]KYC57782.1 MAG: Thermosome subunit alpha [Candidatus Methanofastidiosum methylthiophilus]
MAEIKQPMGIQPEGSQRYMGKDALRMNIMAGRIVAEIIKTTLGPKGMDKMLVDYSGNVMITNDGATILNQIDISHPAAKMIVEVARTQDQEVGDGTTTAVVLAGELLKKAETLLDQNVHVSTIISGYNMATEKAINILRELGEKVTIDNEKTLIEVAKTSMTGKAAEKSIEKLAKIAVDAVKIAINTQEGVNSVSKEDIKITVKEGGGLEDSTVIKGLLVDENRALHSMPQKIKNAKIAILTSPIEVKKTGIDAKIRITSPENVQAFLDQEEFMLKRMVDRVNNSGANVLVCKKNIDDSALHFLSNAGIYALKNVSEKEIKMISKAAGAKIINMALDLEPTDLGKAELVEERKVGDEYMTFIEGCQDPKISSILIRGGTKQFVDIVERVLDDAIGVLIAVVKEGIICTGAGSTEMEISKQLSTFSNSIKGREQLSIKAFAESLEGIPKAIAENSGIDMIDTIVNLRAAHNKDNSKTMGINVKNGKVEDMLKAGVVEPLKLKEQAIKSASESVVMILRIDDVLAGKELAKSESYRKMSGSEQQIA